jgi:hypothetical protein
VIHSIEVERNSEMRKREPGVGGLLAHASC